MKSATKSNVEFQPTLVIGLGGTGHGVLLKLKKRFVDKFGDVPPVVRFLAIDTTQEAERTEYTSNQTAIELEPNDEMSIVQVEDSSGLIGTKNPHIDKWWTPGTPVSAIVSGAQQMRALGRLALFANYDEIKNRITQKLDEIRQINNEEFMQDMNLSVSRQMGVDVYIITSLAGGTGSGMFLDIAFITRSIVSSCNITGLFVLPRVFAKLPGMELIKANTYAALKEIEYFAKLKDVDRLSVDYGINVISIKKPPFDLMYLIDSINESEKIIDSHKLLHSQIADGLYLLIGSEMGTGSSNAIDNIKGHLVSAGLVENRSTAYCSFGVSSCTWNFEEYQHKIEKLKTISARNLVNNLLNARSDPDDLKTDTDRISQKYNLNSDRADEFLQMLVRQDGGAKSRPFWSEIKSSLSFNRNALEKIRQYHLQYKDRYENQSKSEQNTLYNKLKEQFSEDILALEKERISKPDFSSYLAEFSKSLLDKIKSLERTLSVQLESAKSSYERVDFTEPEALISKKSKGFFVIARAKKIKNACINYAGAVDIQRQYFLKKELCEKGINLLSKLEIDIGVMLQKCRNFRSTLKSLLDNMISVAKEPNMNLKEKNPFELVLSHSPEKLTPKELSAADFAQWHNGSLDELMGKPHDEVKDHIIDFVSGKYVVSAKLTIDEVVRLGIRQNSETAYEDHLNHLSHLAAPLWRYNNGEIPLTRKAINRISYCGVGNSNDPPIKNLRGGWLPGMEPNYIRTIDSDRIIFFNISFGVPLFALNGIREMEEEYYAKRTGSCHLHREWQNFPDLIPKRLNSALSCFAIAQAPGFEIVRTNNAGIYTIYLKHPEGQKGKIREVPLAQTPEEAFDKFEKNIHDIEAVKNQVLDIINSQNQNVIVGNLSIHRDSLSHLVNNNGLSPASIDFVRREIDAIQDYIERTSQKIV